MSKAEEEAKRTQQWAKEIKNAGRERVQERESQSPVALVGYPISIG